MMYTFFQFKNTSQGSIPSKLPLKPIKKSNTNNFSIQIQSLMNVYHQFIPIMIHDYSITFIFTF